MPPALQLAPLAVSDARCTRLKSVAGSVTIPYTLVLRASPPGPRFVASHRQMALALSRRRHPESARRLAIWPDANR